MILGLHFTEWWFAISIGYLMAKYFVGGDEDEHTT